MRLLMCRHPLVDNIAGYGNAISQHTTVRGSFLGDSNLSFVDLPILPLQAMVVSAMRNNSIKADNVLFQNDGGTPLFLHIIGHLGGV